MGVANISAKLSMSIRVGNANQSAADLPAVLASGVPVSWNGLCLHGSGATVPNQAGQYLATMMRCMERAILDMVVSDIPVFGEKAAAAATLPAET